MVLGHESRDDVYINRVLVPHYYIENKDKIIVNEMLMTEFL